MTIERFEFEDYSYRVLKIGRIRLGSYSHKWTVQLWTVADSYEGN